MTRLVLVLDAALPGAGVGLVAQDLRLVAQRRLPARPGAASGLASAVAALLAETGLAPASLALIAVTVGPGSFTGLRASSSLALGLAAGSGVPAVGVSTGKAIGAALGDLGGRALWVATWARRGRVYLEIDGQAKGYAIDALPAARIGIAVAGDAAIAVASHLAARGTDVMLTDARSASLTAVAALALAGHGQAVAPLYVDAPGVTLPAGGLRPAPLP